MSQEFLSTDCQVESESASTLRDLMLEYQYAQSDYVMIHGHFRYALSNRGMCMGIMSQAFPLFGYNAFVFMISFLGLSY
jgi:hypothetical protein